MRVQPRVCSYAGLSPSGQQSLGAPGRDVISHPGRVASTSAAPRCEPQTSLHHGVSTESVLLEVHAQPQITNPGRIRLTKYRRPGVLS